MGDPSRLGLSADRDPMPNSRGVLGHQGKVGHPDGVALQIQGVVADRPTPANSDGSI